jgi:dienelactone hydrolase
MKNLFAFAATAIALLLGGGVARAAALPASAFAYTPIPLDVHVVSTAAAGGVRTSIVTFASTPQRRVSAETVAPVSGANQPGILFVHWLGDAPTTNHREFERDAHVLARRGITCVLLDASWSTVTTNGADWFFKVRSTSTDYANSIAQVIDLRRGLDLLVAQPNVDPDRIAYVGHDFGSMYGAVLAGVDPRPRFYVLMAGVPSFATWFLLGKAPADVPAYRAEMAPLDPPLYLGRATAKGFMFQFAAHDEFVTAEHANAFFTAAPLPRAMFVYDAKHDLDIPLARADRIAWLSQRLLNR